MREVEVRSLQPQTTIAVRHGTTADQLSTLFQTELPRLATRMADVHATMTGPPFARYHAFGPDHVDVEIGAPIESAPTALEPITDLPEGVLGRSSLPGGLTAVLVHEGPYDTLRATYERLTDWLATSAPDGYVAGPGPWESYTTDPATVPDPADWLTDVCWPLILASTD
jgi:GyrI-like small molecule binding domain